MTSMHAMRYRVAAMVLCCGAVASVAEPTRETRLEESRALAAAMQTGLQQKLLAAMQRGGAVAAIEVCRSEAPAVAASLSGGPVSRVARTSLRLRNPANAASPGEAAVLERFEALLRSGADAETLEDLQDADGGGMRYMKAIVVRPQCLACHGDSIDPAVQRALDESYPDDAAFGYATGDLRGAFVVYWADAAVTD
jgi:hypothetical protein